MEVLVAGGVKAQIAIAVSVFCRFFVRIGKFLLTKSHRDMNARSEFVSRNHLCSAFLMTCRILKAA
jgi:hypothetical protein